MGRLAIHMSTEMCRILPVFHSLTGCDTTSFFQGLARNQHNIYEWCSFECDMGEY